MNPHTRYEVPVFRVPSLVVIVFAALAVGVLFGTIYLSATQPGALPDWRDLIPKKPAVPDVSTIIQRELDAHNPFLPAKGGR